MSSNSKTLSIKVEFGGGLELLFGNQRIHHISLPHSAASGQGPSGNSTVEKEQLPSNVSFLLHWLKENLLIEREELFMDGDTVRPGILVLINDADWELEGEGDYILKDGDEIVLISTLHGG